MLCIFIIMEDFYSIMDEEIKGKVLVVRIDINSSLKQGKPLVNKRIKLHSQTLKFLSEKRGKIIALGHQGRKGKFNFSSLEEHSKIISEEIGKNIEFVRFEEDWISKIQAIGEGEIILLDNVRNFDDEMNETAEYCEKLLPFVDFYVIDAFSVAHRAHASVVGFKDKPCFAGPVFAEEYKALHKIKGRNTIYFLGGAKVEDTLLAISSMIKKETSKKFFISGIPSKVFLKAKGFSFGKDELLLKKFDNEVLIAKKILSEYPDKIFLPLDYAYLKDGLRTEISIESLPCNEDLLDIGDKTIKEFSKHIEDAETIVLNGAPGVYETEEYRKGTCSLLYAISQSKSFSFIGGGDTEVSLTACGIDESLFSHVSISGKAMLDYLADMSMPGLEIILK